MKSIKDYVNIKKNAIKNLPKGLNISVMTADIKDTKLEYNLKNIYDHLMLDENKILEMKYNKGLKTLLINKKRKVAKKDFYNQLSLVMRVYNVGHEKDIIENKGKKKINKVNFKLFNNGSIQISGIKNIIELNLALNKLFNELKRYRVIERKRVYFAKKFKKLDTSNFKINMINSNYSLNTYINRDNLYQLLLKKKIKCTYEKAIRACVIVKYKPDNINKDVSIFIFRKGNILITGAKSQKHIVDAFNYINNIILEHINLLFVPKEEVVRKNIIKYYNEIIEENKHKLDEIFENGVVPKLILEKSNYKSLYN
jgi:TATA-box binding protein (TBP) (component of TFIID and TFIIIB)